MVGAKETGVGIETIRRNAIVCTFCGRSREEARRLVAGPGCYICDRCIAMCNEIPAEEENATTTPTSTDANPTMHEAGGDEG